MNRLFSLILALALVVGLAVPSTVEAQSFGSSAKMFVSEDFNKWVVYSSTAVAAGAATITIENPWQPTAGGFGLIQPFVASSLLRIDAETAAVAETITVTSASCTQPTVCTVTATFGQAHAGRFSVRSGSAGVNEAAQWAKAASGGTVIVPAGSAATTAMLTGVIGGGNTVAISDVRTGNPVVYNSNGTTYSGATSGAVNGATVTEHLLAGGVVKQSVIQLAATPMTVTDALAYAGLKIYDFPEGRILVLGSTGSLAFTTTSTIASTINSAANMDWAIGTVTASNITLATTMLDLLPKVDNPTSTTINVAAAATSGMLVASAHFDGTTTAVDAFLNVSFPTNTEIDADGTLTVTGTITITWVNLGDL